MKRHEFDTLSFIAGLLTAAVGLLFLIPAATSDLIGLAARLAVWVWPVLFLIIGVAVLVPLFVSKEDDGSVREPEGRP